MSFYELEDKKLLSLVDKRDRSILDVGCGTGRYLIPLANLGHEVIGVDVNQTLLTELNCRGLCVVSPDDFGNIDVSFDCVIMSHIIEHIEPRSLISFMDRYLQKLRQGGHLIIAAPCLYNEFYDDYDHIKPYTPKAISVLYSDYQQQQTKPCCRLRLVYVWYRRWPIIWRSYPGQGWFVRRTREVANSMLAVAFCASAGLISRTTGWIGVFEKM